jgi:hypothetical protein
MKRFFLGAIIVLLAARPGFTQTKNPAVSEAASETYAAAKRSIDKGNAQWIEAWEKGDPEMLAAIFTDDGVMLSQGGRVFKAKVANRFSSAKERRCKASRARSRSR